MGSYNTAECTAADIKKKIHQLPTIGIICGSDLGSLAETVTESTVIKYEDIKEFPKSTVDGHAGNFVFGKLGGKDVAVMQGRIHPYEGYEMSQVTLPVRVMKLLGVETLIVTNAAGGLNPNYNVGDVMIIKDHIGLPIIAGLNPLVGPNEDKFGPRFPTTKCIYTKELRVLAKEIFEELGISEFIREGIYISQMGPSYETPAEARLFQGNGADAVGMSTTHETIVAKHAGMKVFAMSLITNKVVMAEDGETASDQEEDDETITQRVETLKEFVTKLVERME